MTLSEVKDFLKAQIDCPNWYVGKRDGSKEHSITVYPTQSTVPVIAIGGVDNTSYATKSVSVLVHWGRSFTPAETKAQEVYDTLFGQTGKIGEKSIIKFDMRTSEPIGMGTDEGGIYEFVINFVIYYKKKG